MIELRPMTDADVSAVQGPQEDFIDACLRGNGHGKAAVLALAGGFEDTGVLYGIGRSRPQHILRLALRSATALSKSRE